MNCSWGNTTLTPTYLGKINGLSGGKNVSRFLGTIVAHAAIPKTHSATTADLLNFFPIFCINLLYLFPGLIRELITIVEDIKIGHALTLAVCVHKHRRHKKDRSGN